MMENMMQAEVQVGQEKAGLGIAKTLAFTAASGLAIGNLYWSQPLLSIMAMDFGISEAQAGTLFTATQLGYAAGVFLLVPLGDIRRRRFLIPFLMGLSALALLGVAMAPTFMTLALALAAVGMSTVSGQIIIPLVSELARPEERGKLIGIVVSGIMLGILLSRTISGLVADLADWRLLYEGAALATFLMALLVRQVLPELPVRSQVSYREQLVGVLSSVYTVEKVAKFLIIGGLIFGVFNLFWTALTFLLSAPPFSFSTFKIGLVSLAGAAGAVASMGAGRLMDKGLGIPAMGILLLVAVLSMAVSVAAAKFVIALVVIAALVSLASQGVAVLAQTSLLALRPAAASRLNSTFVVNNFLFAAVGSALASFLWGQGGWLYVACGGCLMAALGVLAWLLFRKSL